MLGWYYVVWFMCVDNKGWRCQHRNAWQIHIIDYDNNEFWKREKGSKKWEKILYDRKRIIGCHTPHAKIKRNIINIKIS